MLTIAIQRANRFDHIIKVRNWVECGAAALVTVLFGIMAWRAPNALVRAGDLVVAASGLWIGFYMLRFGREALIPAPDRSLSDYQQGLLREYEHQIRLLKNVKYWYLLPPYVGLLLASAGTVMARAAEGRPGWPELIAVAIYTAVFGGVWWLNEGLGVRKVQRERSLLLEEIHGAMGDRL